MKGLAQLALGTKLLVFHSQLAGKVVGETPMRKYFAITLWFVMLFPSLGMKAQIASGNVAQSASPQSDPIRAQNPRIHRTLVGCVSRAKGEYRLATKNLGILRLSSSNNEALQQYLGHRVTVRGNLLRQTGGDINALLEPSQPGPEMTVERIEEIAGSCPLN